MNDGDTHNGPSEQVEAKYPLLVERYALRPDSGGAGRYRGGLGAEQVVQARHPIRFNAQMERARCQPWGLVRRAIRRRQRGRDPPLRRADETRFPNAKALNQVLQPATPTSCAPAAAAASARRSTASRRLSPRMCGRAMCRATLPNVSTESSSTPAAPLTCLRPKRAGRHARAGSAAGPALAGAGRLRRRSARAPHHEHENCRRKNASCWRCPEGAAPDPLRPPPSTAEIGIGGVVLPSAPAIVRRIADKRSGRTPWNRFR